MKRDDIIRMTREACDADKVDAWSGGFWTLTQEELERFAALVAAAEREACAKVCEEQASASIEAMHKAKLVSDGESYRSAAIGAKFCVGRIRARSTP